MNRKSELGAYAAAIYMGNQDLVSLAEMVSRRAYEMDGVGELVDAAELALEWLDGSFDDGEYLDTGKLRAAACRVRGAMGGTKEEL